MLEELVKDAQAYMRMRAAAQARQFGGAGAASALDTVHVPLEDLKNKAKELGIHDLSGFFRCKLFRRRGFQLDTAGKQIIKQF